MISSLRGKDGNDPEHVLTLENVYQWVDGKRLLNNDRFRFKTEDGYELLVQLPQQPDEALQQDITPSLSSSANPPLHRKSLTAA